MATSTRVGWKVSHLSNLSSRKKNHTWKWQAALGRAIHFLGMPPQLWLRNQLSLPSNIWQIWATYFATHFRSRWCESGPNKSMMRIIVNLDPKKCDVNHRESGHQKKSPHVFHHHTLWCWNKWSTSGTERKLSKSLESWQHRVDVCRRGTWYPWGCHEKKMGYPWISMEHRPLFLPLKYWNENLMINWNDHLTILDENYIPIIKSSTGIGIMPAWDCFNLWPVSWENRLRNHYQSWGYLWSQLVGMVDHGIHIPPVIWRMENHQLNS
jgi:hypothetical protein